MISEEGLAARLIAVQEQERARIARELHGDVGHSLALLQLTLGRLAPSDTTGAVADATRIVEHLLGRLRAIWQGLRPVALDELGLAAALRALLAHGDSASRVRLTVADALPRMPHDVELAAFRVVQEAVANALRHAGPCEIGVRAVIEERGLVVVVSDDGAGFVPVAAMSAARLRGSLGLSSLRERVAALGSALTIESSPGRGTVVTARFTLQSS